MTCITRTAGPGGQGGVLSRNRITIESLGVKVVMRRCATSLEQSGCVACDGHRRNPRPAGPFRHHLPLHDEGHVPYAHAVLNTRPWHNAAVGANGHVAAYLQVWEGYFFGEGPGGAGAGAPHVSTAGGGRGGRGGMSTVAHSC